MATSSFPKSPDQLFGTLFQDVQLGHVFADSKTFVDCVPKLVPEDLVALYESEKTKVDFDLAAFVHEYFVLPDKVASDYVSDTTITTTEHINRLWDRLTRQADPHIEGSSRIPLPHPYVVPGGRFREIFYWDSYFTMLGLKESGRIDLIRGMLDNFAFLIDQFGFIPNGNRTYFLSRSQPPYFALMVSLLAEIEGKEALVNYQPQLLKEYDFWMDGHHSLTDEQPVDKRVVKLEGNRILNRYWDNTPTPRPEAYRQEIELTEEAQPLGVVAEELYTHIRAACESGWDFSSRWFKDQKAMTTIDSANIVSIDLNCLLYWLEVTLHDTALRTGNHKLAYDEYDWLIKDRKKAIQQTFWNEETGFFHDYDVVAGRQTEVLTLAGAFPLFFKLATPEQAARVHDRLKADFLQAGGWVTTLNQTGQQWDWPNGWAPLQWIVYRALTNYGFTETANEGRDRWLALNDKVFRATGKMMEKYNVVDAAITTGGGEYPNQDGFGWTNGVYLAMSVQNKD
ncbi:alpha,alpha-trehalase TreF [Spirosoma sp. HMF4905]|uniref:Alpha,alpha-trehalase TreF n=1 Tax=Spirosoma arboris TaxID=2682092 RepID=A0A7K1SNC0_9BACT|nr:alpha,alpha-trehalase TreF [Spirosoma arboris]MVM35106.1 alpha,alpha-trehalase TreF [Spirosoma arboris]